MLTDRELRLLRIKRNDLKTLRWLKREGGHYRPDDDEIILRLANANCIIARQAQGTGTWGTFAIPGSFWCYVSAFGEHVLQIDRERKSLVQQ